MRMFSKITKTLLVIIGFLIILIILFFGQRDIPLDELKNSYATASSSFISIEGMDVHYRDEGDASDSIPLVLIHGTGSSLHTFENWTSQLKQYHRVIRMDLPGYGITGPFPDRDYSIDHYTAFIKNFLVSKGIKKCILGGNSLGGRIAWNVTIRHPELVDKLILIDATGYPFEAKNIPLAFKVAQIPILKNAFTYITPRFVAKASVENVFADKTLVTEALVDRYFKLTLREGNRQAFVDRLNTKNDTSNYEAIKTITQPTLVLWGEEDMLIPKEKAYRFHNDLPNDTLVILKGVGHVPMEESPTESLKPVISFLQSN